MADCIDKKFPHHALLPKNETGVSNFLKKYPEYNGKNVTIAILDSGVDPAADGLTNNPDGSVKVIERYDCSGAGDVDTSTIVKSANGFIKGISGRQLKISQRMYSNNVTGTYNIGLKSFSELHRFVRKRVNALKKLQTFNEFQKKAIADVSREINNFDTKNTNSQTISFDDKLIKENLENALEFLNSFEKKYDDIKMSYDCLLYKINDNCWEICIDVTETGDLENALYIHEYSKTHELKYIDEILAISINVHDNGNLLEIVGMCSSHATHVASIACSNNNNCEIDGVAPAAKIVSLTIGDVRLGTMETGTCLVRAAIKIMELCKNGTKIDVVNMSYAENAHWSNSGRVGSIINEVIDKYGVVWVTSAGNGGPALSTVAQPPDIHLASMIGVGAYVSPEMMEADYSLRSKLPGNICTWSSRDPCNDGGQAITVCAPGAAIASIPQCTLLKRQLMNGTSMSAPHVAGAIALLISGLKYNNIQYSPYSIKRALWNTATKIGIDAFAEGNGLLNVERAYEHLIAYSDSIERDMRFFVKVGPKAAKGIYLRSGYHKAPIEYAVEIVPTYTDDKNTDPYKKINFSIQLILAPTEPWIQCPTYLDMSYSSRTILFKIDPIGLPIGVHKAGIKAYDSSAIDKGTLFEIPITVIQPITVDVEKTTVVNFDKCLFKPNTIMRHFILVPKYATCAILTLNTSDNIECPAGKFMVHTLQILPDRNCKYLSENKILHISRDHNTVHTFPCAENNILELCISKFWSNIGESNISYSLEFHGIHTISPITMHSALGIHRIDLKALTTEEIAPNVQLKHAVQILKPTESKITPLSNRDVIPPERQIYQNLLTYNLHLNKPQELSIMAPLFYTTLYESYYESQLWMLYDVNKMMLATGDYYSDKDFIKLEKGDYTIRLQVRHDMKDRLETISDATMIVKYKLSNAIVLDCYPSYNLALSSSKKISLIKTLLIPMNEPIPIYVPPIPQEKLLKLSIPNQCSWLEGCLFKNNNEIVKNCDTTPFMYIITEGTLSKKSNGSTTKDTKNKYEDLMEQFRDYQNSLILKFDLDKAEEFYQDVIKQYPQYLNPHLSLAQKLDPLTEIKIQLPFTYYTSFADIHDLNATKNTLKRINDLIEIVIKGIDVTALLSFYGTKSDNRPDAVKIKSATDKQKALLLEAYVRKIIVTAKLDMIEQMENKGYNEQQMTTSRLNDIDNIYIELMKFIDPVDLKVILASIWHAHSHKHYGRMINYLNKLYDDKLQREVLEELIIVVGKMGWSHIVGMLQTSVVSANPMSYRLH